MGQKAQGENMVRGWRRKGGGTSVSRYPMATLYAGLGDNDTALQFLEKA